MNSQTPLDTRRLALFFSGSEQVHIDLHESFRQVGLRIVHTADDEDAIGRFGALHPDVVLIDLDKPGFDGFEVCRKLRESEFGRHIPILMMADSEDFDSISRAFESGSSDFVAKPINYPMLTLRLRYLLRDKMVADNLLEDQLTLQRSQRIAKLGSWEFDLKNRKFSLNRQAREVLLVEDANHEIDHAQLLNWIVDGDRDHFEHSFHNGLQRGSPYDLEFRVNRSDGELIYVHQETEFLRDPDGVVSKAVGTFQDITEKAKTRSHIEQLAFFDTVTGLPNRAYFIDRLSHLVATAQRYQRCMALMFIDLDQFKRVNDTWGHEAGDLLLKQVSLRISDTLRKCDVMVRFDGEEPHPLARLGGDEFVVLLPQIRKPEDAGIVARRIVGSLKEPFKIENNELLVSVSIGISIFPNDGTDEKTLLRHADAAMYRVKEEGRNGFHYYESGMNSRAIERLNMETSLWRALEREEFVLMYQPKIDQRSLQVVGVEALLRWHHPDIGLIVPGEFITIAEETGLILPLGQWVIDEACRQLEAWSQQLPRPLQMSINMSARQFAQDNNVEQISSALNQNSIAPNRLQLELTENTILGNFERHARVMDELREFGVGVVLDNFGTGYSSLAYLKELPIDGLKIDRSSVRQIGHSERDMAVVRATITLCRMLNIRVTAEGIENTRQVELLKAEQCDEFQGYFYSPALSPDDFVDWMYSFEELQPPSPVRRTSTA